MASRQYPGALALIALLALGLALGLASPAAADNISLSYRGQESVSYKVNSQTFNVSTAEFYSVNPFWGQDWIGYCVDPTQYFANPLPVVSTSVWAGPAVGSANWMEAAWLLENFSPGVSWLVSHQSVNYGSSTVRDTIQAVQLAIWEVIVDASSSYSASSLSQGGFRYVSGDAQALNMAGQYLVALDQAKQAGGGTASLSGNLNFAVGQSANHQDILLASQGAAATPEPGTLVLAASGLGLAFWRRRRAGA